MPKLTFSVPKAVKQEFLERVNNLQLLTKKVSKSGDCFDVIVQGRFHQLDKLQEEYPKIHEEQPPNFN